MRSKSRRRRLSVRAAGTAAALPLVALAFVPSVGAAPIRHVVADYDCTAIGPLGQHVLSPPITVTGTAPASVPLGTRVKLSGFQVEITVPASIVNQVLKYADALSGRLTTFDVKATDATSATVNVAGKGIAIPTSKLTKNTPLTLVLPAKPATVGSWKPAKVGAMHFSTGALDFTIDVKVQGQTFPVTVTCAPHPSKRLASTAVTAT